MHNKMTKRSGQGGYSLIELAITLVIVGFIATPAIVLYQQNKIKTDYEKTTIAVGEAIKAIGDFRSNYGRYPCPSPLNVDTGHAQYGLEDCSGATSTPSLRSDITAGNILIGALPFKSMNLQEKDLQDAYGMRLTYAVTESQTVADTFTMNTGGIDLLDVNSDSVITPAASAHFVVTSHGRNKGGAYSRAGNLQSDCTALGAETENCDMDGSFTVIQRSNDYDDHIGYFAPQAVSEWQIEDVIASDINLKGARSIAVGVYTNQDLSNAEKSAIRTGIPDSGHISSNNNVIRSANLCQYGETPSPSDCFDHELLTENHAPGTGLVCPDATPYLIGIDRGTPVCSDEITISCPTGMYMSGFDTNGNILCEGAPPPGCEERTYGAGLLFCKEAPQTIPATDHSQFQSIYSGQCYKFPSSYNSAYVAATAPTIAPADMATWINTINNVDREQSACGDTADTALVRETFQCDAGEWKKVSTHERLTYSPHSFSTNLKLNSGTQNAEQNWGSYSYSKTIDRYNGTSAHDCWCREDYYLTTPACPNGLSGNGITIQKYRCPQTHSSPKTWETVYQSFDNCACAPRETTTTQSCVSYYNAQNGTSFSSDGLTGSVYLKNNYVCNASGQSVLDSTTYSHNTCVCPYRAPVINKTACPAKTTNSFSWTLGANTYTEKGVAAITTREFTCPGTTDIKGISTPGSWGPTTSVPGIPPCACDNGYYEDRIEACPNGKEGAGITKRFVLNCDTGEMIDSGMVVKDECHSCRWNAGNSGEDSDSKLGGSSKKVGMGCSCGSPTAPVCWDDGGVTADYKTYTNCQCVIDLN